MAWNPDRTGVRSGFTPLRQIIEPVAIDLRRRDLLWMNQDDDALGFGRVEVRRGFLTAHAAHELLTKKTAVRVVFDRGVTSNFEIVHVIGGRL